MDDHMSAAKKGCNRAIKLANGIINIIVLLMFLLFIAFGSYAIWDSAVITESATAARYERYKPSQEDSDSVSFEELQRINPDVFGWLTVYGTLIDYPLLQGEDNAKYISTSPEGQYSMTGAIFLDCSNSRDFQDFNSIIYGHNMVPQVMFGSIKNFKEKNFFDTHKYGNLYFQGENHGIEIFGILVADAYAGSIYSPGLKNIDEKETYLNTLFEKSLVYRDIGVTVTDRIVLLSTCSTEGTNERDILVGRITEETYENEFNVIEEEKEVTNIDSQDESNIQNMINYWRWLIVGILILLITLYRMRHRRSDKQKKGPDKNG